MPPAPCPDAETPTAGRRSHRATARGGAPAPPPRLPRNGCGRPRSARRRRPCSATPGRVRIICRLTSAPSHQQLADDPAIAVPFRPHARAPRGGRPGSRAPASPPCRRPAPSPAHRCRRGGRAPATPAVVSRSTVSPSRTPTMRPLSSAANAAVPLATSTSNASAIVRTNRRGLTATAVSWRDRRAGCSRMPEQWPQRHDAGHQSPPIPMTQSIRPRRSVLYMPGANARALEKARTLARRRTDPGSRGFGCAGRQGPRAAAGRRGAAAGRIRTSRADRAHQRAGHAVGAGRSRGDRHVRRRRRAGAQGAVARRRARHRPGAAGSGRATGSARVGDGGNTARVPEARRDRRCASATEDDRGRERRTSSRISTPAIRRRVPRR